MNIQGKTFIITGGGSGLGAATAQAIVAAGGNVVLADVNPAQGEACAQRLSAKARFVKADVTSEADVKNAIATALKDFGGLHGAVNCAGVGAPAKVLGKEGPHPLDVFQRVVHINLIGTFNVIRLCAAAMAEQTADEGGERGVIINTSSVASYEGQIGQAAYSASKGGINAMTLPIARELARNGIRVVTIAPGLFDTPMMAGLPEAARESLGAQVPFPSRLGHPEEYAALAKHIIENTMLNGSVIRLDGAIRMAPK